jgi:NADH-quinone oxidoreductase subunit H
VPHPLFAAFDLLLLLPGVIGAFVLIGFLLVSAIFSVWLERKVAGRIQDRLGPTRVGGKFGWLQTLADGMKLLVKEDIIPASADHMLFRLGPYIALAGSFLAFLALPFGNQVVAADLNIAVFFMLAVMSTEVFGIILIGYGSGSKWSLFGGMREAAQMVSYEIPMALCILVPVIVAGSMNLNQVAMQQSYGIQSWYLFHDPFTFAAFWTYFTCAMASCKRAPFDLAEAESELVAGFHTEYSGFRWLVIFMAEYGSMFAVSGIASIMFLGGWSLGIPGIGDLSNLLTGWLGSVDISANGLFGWLIGLIGLIGLPLPPLSTAAHTIDFGFIAGNVVNVVVFIAKGWFLVFVMMWVRWTLPRLRIDQVMMTCLKYLIPISCVLLMGVSLWQLFLPGLVIAYFKYVMLLVCLGLAAWVLVQLFTMAKAPPGSIMPGVRRLS